MRTASSRSRALLRLLRPKQWAKNVLVFAAPGAGGTLAQLDTLTAALIAFVAFCLAASGTYCLNDAADVHADRRHPRKRLRPVASGEISVAAARLLGGALIAFGLLIAVLLGNWPLGAVLLAYIATTTSYTLWLKHLAVFDIGAVASGFILRTLGGAAVTGETVSDWFLIVASFGALFIVAGKRTAESGLEGDDGIGTRAVLARYPRGFLVYVQAVASGVTLLAYCLWAFEKARFGGDIPWYQLSIIPFVLALFRYALRVYSGEGGAPEDIVLGDRSIALLGLIWLLLFGTAVYAS